MIEMAQERPKEIGRGSSGDRGSGPKPQQRQVGFFEALFGGSSGNTNSNAGQCRRIGSADARPTTASRLPDLLTNTRTVDGVVHSGNAVNHFSASITVSIALRPYFATVRP